MPINFTDSPANGAIITQGNITYTYNSSKGVWNRTIEAASGLSEYATLSALPLVDVEDDTLVKVLDTNKLYKWTGTGWYFLDPVNTNPTITTAGDAAYNLSMDGTPTVVTLAANDPEGFPIIWSYAVTAGSLGSTATVAQADNVFTITPSIVDANAGDFTLTFTASDGVNIDTSTSEFSLAFSVANTRYTSLLAQAVSTGTNSTFVDASAEAHTVTNTGVVAGTVTPYSPSYSAYLDGSGDYFAINSGTVANFGTGDFTIEMWWNRKDAIDPGLVFESRPANTSGDYITLSILGANIAYYAGSGAVNISTPHNVSVGDWAHLAVVRTGGYVKVYVNGTQIATSADTINYLSGSTPWIGKNAFQPGDWTNVISLSNYRITKAAVYTDNFIPATQPLGAITGTTLLTFQSNRFVDNSGNNVGLIVSGNPEIVPESPFNRLEYSEAVHGSSGYFNGSSKLTLANSASLSPGSGDFTLEAWVYLNTVGTAKSIISTFNGGSGYWDYQIKSGNVPELSRDSGSVIVAGSTVLTTGQWYHLAATRSGTTVRHFTNGVLDGTNTNSVNITSGNPIAIGATPNNINLFSGFISNLRLIKSTPVYTAAFTPPTAPVTEVANTTFLMNPNPSIIDKAQKNTISLVGNVTSASPPVQLFGTPNAVSFDGNDRINTSNVSAFDLSSSTAEFTIEGWLYRTATSYNGIIGARQNGITHGWCLYIHPNGTLYTGAVIVGNSYADRQMNTTVIPLNTWTHFALVKTTAGYKAYINGIGGSDLLLTGGLDYQPAHELAIGALGSTGEYPFTGNISNMRIVKGTAVYTSNFAPPTENLTAIANTSLLTCQGSSIVDASTNAHTFTVTGDAASVNSNPYGTEKVMTFDGSGDWVIVSDNSPDFGFGTGDFTIECWINPTTAGSQDVFSMLSNLNTAPHLYIDPSSRLVYYHTGSARITGTALTTNQWQHIAVCRSSNSTKLFLNGSQVGSTYSDTSNYGTSNPCVIGSFYNSGSIVGGANSMQGYIQDARVTKGLARYTSNFTPPTALLEG